MIGDFYRSKQWAAFRQVVISERLVNGYTIDEYTGQPILRPYDIILHHKIPLTENNVHDAEIALNSDNIMIVSARSHNLIHNKLGYVCKQVYLVWGSPLSGKSTWVNNVRNDGDLIVDMDNIWECISGCDRYIKPDRLKGVAFGVRDHLLDMVQYRRGKWCNAYVIGSYPLSGERERIIKRLGAREVYIDCTYEECIARLRNCQDERRFSEWKKYIDEWWKKQGYPPCFS